MASLSAGRREFALRRWVRLLQKGGKAEMNAAFSRREYRNPE
jgi:hypothetical protein